MPDLFGVNIQGILSEAIGDGFPLLTLRKVRQGARSASDPAAGKLLTRTSYQARGILDSYADRLIDETIVKVGDRKVLLLGGSLPSNVVPETQDEIVAEGKTWKIIRVERDPAAATYTCQVREVS